MVNFLTRIAKGNKTSEVKGHDADDSKNIKQSLWKIAGKFKCHVRRLIQFAPAIDNLSPLDLFCSYGIESLLSAHVRCSIHRGRAFIHQRP